MPHALCSRFGLRMKRARNLDLLTLLKKKKVLGAAVKPRLDVKAESLEFNSGSGGILQGEGDVNVSWRLPLKGMSV